MLNNHPARERQADEGEYRHQKVRSNGVENVHVEPAGQCLCNVECLPEESAQTANDAAPRHPAILKYIAIDGDSHTHHKQNDANGLDAILTKDRILQNNLVVCATICIFAASKR